MFQVSPITRFNLGNIDELLEPFMDDVDEAQAKKLFKLFFTHIDRTVLDSFSHADIGPKATRAGRLILEVERELLDAVPNITMKYDTDITPDDFGIECVKTALKTAKPSFANHKMFKKELGENYVIASCYNGLLLGGGSYTLCRLILGIIAKRAKDKKDFFENQLPYVRSAGHFIWMNAFVLRWRRAAFSRATSLQKKALSTEIVSPQCLVW